MVAYRVSEAAEATGFTADTLRYYERIGLLAPESRSEAGYRLYSDADLDALHFIAHAKAAGLSLEDIAELLELWRTGDCGTVRDRLHELVCERSESARRQADELGTFADQLDRLSSRLAGSTPPERCGPRCGCGPEPWPAELIDRPAVLECTLAEAERPDRLAQWRTVLASASVTEHDNRTVSIRLPADARLAARVAELAAREQECCGGLLELTIRPTPDALFVEAEGPHLRTFLAAAGR
jgi:DNA-binding transcriptional MerR regulator